MAKGKQQSVQERGRFLAQMHLEQLGYRVLPSDERGISFYVWTGDGLAPVKVRTIRYGSWQFAADKLLDITVSKGGVQTIHVRKQHADADMRCILVRLDEEEFYVLRLGQLYDVVCNQYENWLAERGGRRPRVPESMHCTAGPEDLAAYRENWQLFEPVARVVPATWEPGPLMGTVRHVVSKFCLEFVYQPYLCYTEHGLHALLFARLFNALWEEERFTTWEGQRVCVIQKEYPTAHDLGKSRRQHWVLSVIKTPAESRPEGDRPAYDYLRLAAAIEVGLNEAQEHLREDIRRLLHKKANIEQGLVLHLYRLAVPGAKISGRDWSFNSPQIVSLDRAAAILSEEQAAEAAADREIEIVYAVAGETGKHEKGAWLIRRGERTRLV